MVTVIRRLGLVLPLLAAAPVAAAVPGSGELVFDILRHGAPIGVHRIGFQRSGDLLEVAVDISIEVKMLMLTLFEYQHRNRETWRGDTLVRIETETDHDGQAFAVRGRRTGAGFEVENGSWTAVLEGPVIPTSYWRADTVHQTRLLNTQTGEVMTVRVTPGTETRILARGAEIEARHYVISGDLELEVWYDADDILVRLRFKASDGSVIDYALRPPAKPTVTAGNGD